MACVGNGVVVSSKRSVSASCVRNIGSPFSSSAVDAGGHGRVLTLTLVLAMIASRYVVTNSYSIGPPGWNALGTTPFLQQQRLSSSTPAAVRRQLLTAAGGGASATIIG